MIWTVSYISRLQLLVFKQMVGAFAHTHLFEGATNSTKGTGSWRPPLCAPVAHSLPAVKVPCLALTWILPKMTSPQKALEKKWKASPLSLWFLLISTKVFWNFAFKQHSRLPCLSHTIVVTYQTSSHIQITIRADQRVSVSDSSNSNLELAQLQSQNHTESGNWKMTWWWLRNPQACTQTQGCD